MAWYDVITDSFTGRPAQEAAEQTRNYLQGVQNTGNADITQGYNTATGAVGTGAAGARTALGTGYNNALGFANAGIGGAINYIDQGAAGAHGLLDQTRAAGNAAFEPLSALAARYGQGTNLLLDSYGVNGAEGNTRAQNAFQAGPGYQFTRDQGIDAINRRRNAGGMLDSGNADRDAINYTTGLADTTYNNWRSGLSQFINPEVSATSTAATGRAGLEQNIGMADASLTNQAGISRAGLESNRGSMLSSLASTYGGNLAGINQGEGNTLAGLATGTAGQRVGLATGLAPAYGNTYGQEAAAQMQGSANLWNLGQNVARLGTGIYAGQPSGGTGSGWTGWNPNVSGGWRA